MSMDQDKGLKGSMPLSPQSTNRSAKELKPALMNIVDYSRRRWWSWMFEMMLISMYMRGNNWTYHTFREAKVLQSFCIANAPERHMCCKNVRCVSARSSTQSLTCWGVQATLEQGHNASLWWLCQVRPFTTQRGVTQGSTSRPSFKLV